MARNIGTDLRMKLLSIKNFVFLGEDAFPGSTLVVMVE